MTRIIPERFALELLPEGGILLDLDSGIFFQLNRTAAFVWEGALAGSEPSEISTAVVRTFNVSETLARSDVDAALSLPPSDARPRPVTNFRYEAADEGYRFWAGDQPIFEVAASRRVLRVMDGFNPASVDLYLRTIAPKLVALLGASVLHASAVERSDHDVMAFLGNSGAGKTTTARMFARAGWRVVCEDKLVLRRDGERLVAALDAEPRVSAWIADARRRLVSAAPGDSFDASALAQVAIGASRPIADVFLIDLERRRGTLIELERLAPAAAAGQIFQNGFYGSQSASEWRRQMHVAVSLARTARSFKATMPDGVGSLEQAAQRYTDITAS